MALNPIPIVAASSGDAADAPAGAIPFAAYGFGGGGGGIDPSGQSGLNDGFMLQLEGQVGPFVSAASNATYLTSGDQNSAVVLYQTGLISFMVGAAPAMGIGAEQISAGKPIGLLSQPTSSLPEPSENGLVAFDSTLKLPVVSIDGVWCKFDGTPAE